MRRRKSLISLVPLWLSLALLFGCSRERLNVYTDYLSYKNLASYRVGTPDPLQNNPPTGQRLILSWNLTKNMLEKENLHLELTVRFRNGEQISENISIFRRSGSYYYYLINDEFFEKKGILTYKVDLIGDGEVIDKWRHQLWTEMIIFDEEE